MKAAGRKEGGDTLMRRTLKAAIAAFALVILAVGCDPMVNRETGRRMAAEMMNWTGQEFNCLDELWGTIESHWSDSTGNINGSYGIPQANPGSKMAAEGPDWATNPVTQISWGLKYIQGRYGTPCAALAHSHKTGWY